MPVSTKLNLAIFTEDIILQKQHTKVWFFGDGLFIRWRSRGQNRDKKLQLCLRTRPFKDYLFNRKNTVIVHKLENPEHLRGPKMACQARPEPIISLLLALSVEDSHVRSDHLLLAEAEATANRRWSECTWLYSTDGTNDWHAKGSAQSESPRTKIPLSQKLKLPMTSASASANRRWSEPLMSLNRKSTETSPQVELDCLAGCNDVCYLVKISEGKFWHTFQNPL